MKKSVYNFKWNSHCYFQAEKSQPYKNDIIMPVYRFSHLSGPYYYDFFLCIYCNWVLQFSDWLMSSDELSFWLIFSTCKELFFSSWLMPSIHSTFCCTESVSSRCVILQVKVHPVDVPVHLLDVPLPLYHFVIKQIQCNKMLHVLKVSSIIEEKTLQIKDLASRGDWSKRNVIVLLW